MKVIIIGGSAGGATCAARLRRLDENAEIVILERGKYISYANCGLPYYIGNVIKKKESLLIQTPQALKRKYNLDIRTESEAVFIDRKNKTVKIKNISVGTEYSESYDKLVLATGSSPLRPKIPGIESDKIFTLWTVPDAEAIKKISDNVKTAVIIGGGFIGLEVAENLSRRGISVTLVDAANQILSPMDYEMAKILQQHVSETGAHLILSDGVDSFAESDKGIGVLLKSGKLVSADIAILSVGIRPNTEIARTAGIELSERGFVEVNEYMQTSDTDIYACGDIARYNDIIFNDRTTVALAGPANRQARIVANNIAGIKTVFKGTQGTSVAKIFDLTAASTGANEKTLIQRNMKKGIDYQTVILTQNNHPGYYPGSEQMIIKLIFSADGAKIFGAQIIGEEGADKRLDVIATAIRLGASIRDLEELELGYSPVYNSPKDPVNMAGFVAQNVIDGLVSFCEWNFDIPNAQLIDVREDYERAVYEIPNAMAMPLGSIRDRADELDRSRPVVVFCAAGVRAYTAARILMNRGFRDVRVYPGGVKVYRATHEVKEKTAEELSMSSSK